MFFLLEDIKVEDEEKSEIEENNEKDEGNEDKEDDGKEFWLIICL